MRTGYPLSFAETGDGDVWLPVYLFLKQSCSKNRCCFSGIFTVKLKVTVLCKANHRVGMLLFDCFIFPQLCNRKRSKPFRFLAMLYGNLLAMRQQGHPGMPELETMEMDIPTMYDDDREEIEELMLRFYPEYLLEVGNGGYRVPEHTEQSLRNIFSQSAVKNYFYEMIPSLANPLGIGDRSMPIAAKVQNLLISDFLNYLALRHEIFLSTLSENDKKKRPTKP